MSDGYDPFLEDSYYADPAAAHLAVSQAVAAQALEESRAEILAQAQYAADEKNAGLVAIEANRLMDERAPDWRNYAEEIGARLQADPYLGNTLDPAVSAGHMELVYHAVKRDAAAVEAENNSAQSEWYRITRAGLMDLPYWNDRRKLLEVPRAQGGFMEKI